MVKWCRGPHKENTECLVSASVLTSISWDPADAQENIHTAR